jgi:hypothetical protein
MEPDRKPDVVDLTKYRKRVREQAKAKTPTVKREPVLGGRPNAALILVLIVAAVIVVFVLPKVLGAR